MSFVNILTPSAFFAMTAVFFSAAAVAAKRGQSWLSQFFASGAAVLATGTAFFGTILPIIGRIHQ